MTTPHNASPQYDPPLGEGDATYRAVGGYEAVRALVDAFYDTMEQDPRYQRIFNMHPPDNARSRDKLARFLSAWMGGPRLYKEKYGSISIPGVHAHLPITEDDKTLWLQCMGEALIQRDAPETLRTYLLTQLAVPATRIVSACAR